MLERTQFGGHLVMAPRLSRALLIALLCVESVSGCENDQRSYDEEMQAMSSAVRIRARELAQKEADQALMQFGATGKVDLSAVNAILSDETAELSNFICGSVKDHSAQKEAKIDDVERDIDRVVTEEAMLALGRRPQLLQAFGFTTWGKWPPFVLKDPIPSSEMAVGDLSAAIGQSVKPEFIASEGGVKLPSVGEAAYEDFKQWYAFGSGDDNGLFEAASALGTPIRQAMRAC